MTQSTINRALAELLEALKNYNAALKNAGEEGNKLVEQLTNTLT